MAEELKKQEKKNVSETDGKVVPRTTAGWVVASQEIAASITTGATQTSQLVNQLLATINQLAEVDLNGKCKGLSISQNSDGETEINSEAFKNAAKGCNPFKNSPAFKTIEEGGEPSPQEIIATVLEIVGALTGPSRFPACLAEQYTKILSIIPVEFYLLLLLKKIAQEALVTVEEIQVQGACKNIPGLEKKIENLDFEIPTRQIPTIPTLPYINIPDLLDILINLILEGICFGICTAVTPLIRTAMEAIQELNQDALDLIAPSEANQNQPLVKVPINRFLNDDVLTEIKRFVDKNIPNSQDISKNDIKVYLNKVQFDERITQEEFVLLLLGKINCDTIDKVLSIPETINVFDLDNENKIVIFFSFVGSTINMLGFTNSSRADVCEPDPCDVKPETLQQISNVCSLLSGDVSSQISIDDLLNQSGVGGFVSDSLKQIFDNIAKLNNTYNPTIGTEGISDSPTVAAAQRDAIQSQSYIQKYSDFILSFKEILIVSYDQAQSTTGPERTVLREATFKVRNKYYNEAFPFADIYAFQQLVGREKLISSDNFTGNNGITTIGLSPKSDFKYNGYSKFTSEQIQNKLSSISEELDIKIEDSESDMEEFLELRKQYIN